MGGEKKKSEQEYVNADMTLGEVVEKYPETIPVLLKHGLHCVGCHVAAWETLREGLIAHGLDERNISAVMKELNTTIKESRKIKKE